MNAAFAIADFHKLSAPKEIRKCEIAGAQTCANNMTLNVAARGL